MNRIMKLRRDEAGTTAIEMAFAFPILIVMIWIIVQLGMVYRAVSGMQHALGEGARFATLFPRPTDAAIKQRVNDKVFGIGPGTFTVADPTAGPNEAGSGTTTAATSTILSVTYTQPTSLLLVPGPTVSLTRTKQVWIAD